MKRIYKLDFIRHKIRYILRLLVKLITLPSELDLNFKVKLAPFNAEQKMTYMRIIRTHTQSTGYPKVDHPSSKS
jgi:hypothetical protein